MEIRVLVQVADQGLRLLGARVDGDQYGVPTRRNVATWYFPAYTGSIAQCWLSA